MSTLQYDRFEDEFYPHARMKRTIEDGEDGRSSSDTHSENPTVLGVDLNGDGYFAVTNTGAFIESADYINHLRREFERTRGSLQETGTRSAHLTIQQMSDRERRWIQDVLHSIANDILHEARRVDAIRIAFENPTGTRDRMVNAKRFHAWAFRQLSEYVEYKGEAEGVTVARVSPAYTSQRCSKCGCTLARTTHRNTSSAVRSACTNSTPTTTRARTSLASLPSVSARGKRLRVEEPPINWL